MLAALAAKRLTQWLAAKRRFRRLRFDFEGQRHRYFAALYNVTFLNERSVEIPLALAFLDRFSPSDVLEVGNVLGHYRPIRHTVVDKYERARGVINEDIERFSPRRNYRAIVSVSTLEHVGWDEVPRDPEKVVRAVDHLRTLLAPGGALFATMALGHNHFLDERIADGSLPFDRILFMKRASADNRWEQADQRDVLGVAYGRPYRNANAIAIGLLEQ